MLRYSILVALGLFLTPLCHAQTLKVDSKRLVNILGPISLDKGLRVAKQIDAHIEGPLDKPIYLLVNSPGGSVIGGYFIIDSIRSAQTKGYKVRCVTGIMAASMAFNILAVCNERWTLPNAQLLWHPARIMTRRPVTADIMKVWVEELDRMNNTIARLIVKSSKMSQDFFDKHNTRETLWAAKDLAKYTKLHWLTTVTRVEGAQHLLSTTDPSDRSFFFQKKDDQYDFGETDVVITDDNKFLNTIRK